MTSLDNPFLGLLFRSTSICTAYWLAPWAAAGMPMMWRP